MNGIKSAGRGKISCLFERAADNRVAAKFSLYHIPQILSSKIYKKIAQIFIPKFVQNCHLFFIKNNDIINYKIKENKKQMPIGATKKIKKVLDSFQIL